jgi:hypothetical protein
VGGEELNGAANVCLVCAGDMHSVALVVFGGIAIVPSLYAVGGPSTALLWCFV